VLSRVDLQRWRRFLPWLSLLTGLLSGVLMNRSPERAWLVVLAALVSWLGLFVFSLAARLDPSELVGGRAAALHAGRFLSRLITQSGVQLSLFFTLPFYLRAYAGIWSHALFLTMLAGVAALTLWDPIYDAVMARPIAGAALQAFATFAGLNVVLPILGMSNAEGLEIAALATTLAIPASVWLTVQGPRRLHTFLLAVLVAMLVPASLTVGAIRSLVPAAPLQLVRADIGTTMRGLELVDPTEIFATTPPRLVCATTIGAPRGLNDELFHVWSKDGVQLDRIALSIRGSEAAGFRTWSNKQNLGAEPAGLWTCTVETGSGQSLGRVQVTIAAPPTAGF
jgi:hypothetical protein